jgi:hypothetical protein
MTPAPKSDKSSASQKKDTKDHSLQETMGDKDNHSPTSAGQSHEIGGPSGPEPTRYGDWEKKGRCYDF